MSKSAGPAVGSVIPCKVTRAVRGGVIVALDGAQKGFVPASLLDVHHVPDLQAWVGRDIDAEVLEPSRTSNSGPVLSRRAVLAAARDQQIAAALERLQPGHELRGRVKQCTDYGAFVDLGDGLTGMIHISELSWGHVKHPSTIVDDGEEVIVRVTEIDRERRRISLTRKQLLPDPFESFVTSVSLGATIEGEIALVKPFGAFVRLAEAVEGLAPAEELTHFAPVEGQRTRVQLVAVDRERRRLTLKLLEVSDPAVPSDNPA